MKTITIELSEESITEAIKQVEKYKEELKAKCRAFVEALMQEGIATAKNAVSGSKFGSYITFTSEVKDSTSNIVGIMLASNTGIIQSEWLQRDGSTKIADVSPLLMVEFGAGQYAQNPKNVPGVGRGTFPGQTHANEPGWWYATGTPENKVWHYSRGIKPSQPMYKACLHMQTTISEVATRIFK